MRNRKRSSLLNVAQLTGNKTRSIEYIIEIYYYKIETLQAINEREYNVAQNIGIGANSKQRTLNIEKHLW